MTQPSQPALARPNNTRSMQLVLVFTAIALTAFAPEAMAQFADAKKSVCGFFGNLQSILSVASVAVVTIAVIFAGYQIAFAHKRISDVAPILIGGLLIGAAGQIAGMLLPNDKACDVNSASAVHDLINVISSFV